MARIFICYRRGDAAGYAGWLREALSAEFGADEIFRDINTIEPGEDFVHAMQRAIESCSVFLAVIGRHWLTAAEDGARRLDDPEDHVRREIEEALRRGVRVVPVLVQGATMPSADELPEALADLSTRNAIALDDDDWQGDVGRLTATIKRELALPPRAGGRQAHESRPIARPSVTNWYSRLDARYVLAAAGAALLLVLLVWLPRTPGTSTVVENTPQASPQGQTSVNGTAVASGTATAGVPSGASTAVTPGPGTAVTLPQGGEAALGEGIYEVLEARIGADTGITTLVVLMRLTNRARYDVQFADRLYRLIIAGQAQAPTASFLEYVAAGSTKEGAVRFDLPSGVTSATLQITSADGSETANVPLDLQGRAGLTPERDREARRGGRADGAVSIDAASRAMRFGEVVCELRSATVRRYVNKLKLTLSVRVHNRARYDVAFNDSNFRLGVGDGMLAPVSQLYATAPAESTRDGDVVFDLPLDARQVTLRTRFADEVTELRLQIPQSR